MDLEAWRDLAVVVLAVEGFVGVLVVGAAIYFGIRGVFWLKVRIPTVTRPARSRLEQVESLAHRAGDAGVAPFIWGAAHAARVRTLWRGIAKRNRRDGNE